MSSTFLAVDAVERPAHQGSHGIVIKICCRVPQPRGLEEETAVAALSSVYLVLILSCQFEVGGGKAIPQPSIS